MSEFNFPKNTKLKKKSEIAVLFNNGKWKTVDQLRIISLKNTSSENTTAHVPKIGVSAAKKNFKKAVDRNRIKRLLRESYRLNKHLFHDAFGENVHAMIFWIGSEKPKNFQIVQENFLRLCKSMKNS